MCGLAGFSGIPEHARLPLVYALGEGIDSRGGHAAGFLTLGTGRMMGADLLSHRRIGTWDDASNKFLYRAASGHTTMMHSRFATCGSKDIVSNAHPFSIKREGETILHGMHNGVLDGTYTSARKYDRPHTVDSRELFELLADDKIEEINELEGYGVITFVRPEDNYVSLVRISKDSDIELVSLEEGGIAWASTISILEDALEFAELTIRGIYKVEDIGRIYKLRQDGAFLGDDLGIKVASRSYSYGYTTFGGAHDSPKWWQDYLDKEESSDSWEKRLMKEWEDDARIEK